MEVKIIPSKKGRVRHEVLIKQINDYLKVESNSKNERHKENI